MVSCQIFPRNCSILGDVGKIAGMLQKTPGNSRILMASRQIFPGNCSIWGDLGKIAGWMLQKILGIYVIFRDV